MKIILFGGSEPGQTAFQLKMIEKVIRETGVKQVLHIPFARTQTSEEEWMPGWFGRGIELEKGVDYLNAENGEDIAKADDPLIFMSGGGENLNLLKKIKDNPRLLELVTNASFIIGESAGAKVLAEYFRTKGSDISSAMVKGLGIIKNTVIQPHYIQRERKELLLKDMKDTGVKYGLGIDSITAIEFDAGQFPEKTKKIGKGIVEIKIR